MNINLKKIIFGDGRNRRTPALLAVTPPRTGERTLLGVENLLQSIAVPEPFSLELAGDTDGVTLMARCLDRQVVQGQLAAHYPQARIREVPPHEDPLRLEPGEQAWGLTLRSGGPEFVPLRTFRDDDLLDTGSDPLIALLGALSDLRPGERLVSRLLLRSLGPDWSQAHQARAHKRAVPEPRDPSYTYQTKPLQLDGVTMAVLGAGALLALRGYLWVQDGEFLKASLLGAGSVLGLTVAGWGWWRWKQSRSRVYDPILIGEKVSRIAFEAELQVVAVLPERGRIQRAEELLEGVAAAYRHYDHPAGARFKVGDAKPLLPTDNLHPAGPGLFGRRSILGVREAAALWHPPGERDETPLVERSGSRSLLPQARGTAEGALVGDTTGGQTREIRFPEDLLRRHHLYVARTRMGKSTLMHHLVTHKLREKAAGRDGDAIIVVDPHADLVAGLLEQVPESLVNRVKLIDLADEQGAPGINLLDTRIFADRDRTADSVVRGGPGTVGAVGSPDAVHPGAHRQDPPRGQLPPVHRRRRPAHHPGRAEAALRRQVPGRGAGQSRRPLHHGVVGAGLRQLAPPVPGRSPGPGADPPGLLRLLQAGPLHPGPVPLHHRPAGDHPGRGSAASLHRPGHRRPGRGRPGGGVIAKPGGLGDPGAGEPAPAPAAGRIGGRGRDAVHARRRLRVDAQRAGQVRGFLHPGDPEPGKAGGPVPAPCRTPSWPTLGCLAVFQVSGNDARRLVWELGKDRVSEDDITSLPVHQCYVRATVGTERLPAYSMMTRKPEPGDPEVAEAVRNASRGYTTSAGQIAAANAEGEQKVSEYRRLLAEHQNANGSLPPQTPATDQTGGQHRVRTRNPNPPGSGSGGAA